MDDVDSMLEEIDTLEPEGVEIDDGFVMTTLELEGVLR